MNRLDITSRIPSTGGVQLAVHDLGGEGPPLLLAHATGFNAGVWRPVARRLPDRQCIALDFRGHGESPVDADHTFDWDRFADDVLALIDHVGLESVDAAGHSKGGAALLLAEQRRPGTFARIWCYEPVVFPRRLSGAANPLAAGARRRRDHFDSRDAAIENFSAKAPFDILDDESLEAYVDAGFATGPDGSVTLRCRPEHEARVYEMGGRHDAFDHLGEVRCPVTVVRGAVGPGPAAVADAIAERLLRGHVEAHDDLGHFGPLEDPGRIADSIMAAFGPDAPVVAG